MSGVCAALKDPLNLERNSKSLTGPTLLPPPTAPTHIPFLAHFFASNRISNSCFRALTYAILTAQSKFPSDHSLTASLLVDLSANLCHSERTFCNGHGSQWTKEANLVYELEAPSTYFQKYQSAKMSALLAQDIRR
jgi:hypothetical protein